MQFVKCLRIFLKMCQHFFFSRAQCCEIIGTFWWLFPNTSGHTARRRLPFFIEFEFYPICTFVRMKATCATPENRDAFDKDRIACKLNLTLRLQGWISLIISWLDFAFTRLDKFNNFVTIRECKHDYMNLINPEINFPFYFQLKYEPASSTRLLQICKVVNL
jgi:hypothetical protein